MAQRRQRGWLKKAAQLLAPCRGMESVPTPHV